MRNTILAAATSTVAAPLLLLAVPASAAPTGQASSVSPMSAACGRTAPDLDHRSYLQALAPGNSGGNQRSGSSTGCGILGVLQPSDYADYHCYTVAGSFTWTYLRNVRTNVAGWVRDDLLKNYGSSVYCGF